MKKKEEKVNLNLSEAKELLLQYVGSIQRIDNQLAILKQERADVFTTAKDEGFNKKLINQVISDIRKEMKADELELSEKDIYEEIIRRSCLVQLV